MTEPRRSGRLRRGRSLTLVRQAGGAGIAVTLCCALLAVNVALDPGQFGLSSGPGPGFSPGSVGTTLGLFAPLALAAMATAPAILAGGFDLSIAPLMGLLSVIIVQGLIGTWGATSPLAIVPVTLGLGLAFGVANGLLHALLRLPSMVATLAMYVVYSGLALVLAPVPGGAVPGWITSLSTTFAVVPLATGVACWALIRRTAFYELLMATGGDDRAAYASGVNVTAVRVAAYGLGGLLCGLAALSLTALLGSADAKVGPTYTLGAVAAVALGGVSLAGGRGGLIGALAGAGTIFWIESLLMYTFTSPFAQPISYGALLVLALCFNAVVLRRLSDAGTSA